MGTIKALDLDAHERAKLRLLPVEKTGAFVTLFVIFAAPVLLCCALILLEADIRSARIYEDGHLSNSATTDGLVFRLRDVADDAVQHLFCADHQPT